MNSYPTISRGRFTEKMCATFVEGLNECLADAGADFRMEVSPRNGYCAIDAYKQSDRDAGHTWVDKCVRYGTPRECAEAAREELYNAINAHAGV